MRRINLVLLLIALSLFVGLPVLAGGGGCHEFTDGETAEVTLDSNCFMPTVTRVPVGATVTWQNADAWEHNVFSPAFADSGTIAAGAGFSFTFEEAGVFPYVCTLHPGMMGTVVVGESSEAAAVSTQVPTNFGIPAVGGAALLALGLMGGWALARRDSTG